MDQGIICVLKAKYRLLAVRKSIFNLEIKAPMIKRKAWNAVSNKTFSNCLKITDISEKAGESILNNEDDSFAD